MQLDPVVSSLVVRPLRRTLKNPAHQKLMPTRYMPEYIEFELHGVSCAVSNAIRRTVLCELPVRHMMVAADRINNETCSDRTVIPELLAKRFRMIPLDQTCPLDAEFKLVGAAAKGQYADVKSIDIKAVSSGHAKLAPFNETFTVLTLQPGTAITVEGIYVTESHGYTDGYGMCVLATNAVSLALGVQPPDAFDPMVVGVPSMLADPRDWKVAYKTNGSLPAVEIAIRACQDIAKRTLAVKGLLEHGLIVTQDATIEAFTAASSPADDEEDLAAAPKHKRTAKRPQAAQHEETFTGYSLTIPGETYTIGNLFTCTILDLYPHVGFIGHDVDDSERKVTMRLLCAEDAADVFVAAIERIERQFAAIERQLRAAK